MPSSQPDKEREPCDCGSRQCNFKFTVSERANALPTPRQDIVIHKHIRQGMAPDSVCGYVKASVLPTQAVSRVMLGFTKHHTNSSYQVYIQCNRCAALLSSCCSEVWQHPAARIINPCSVTKLQESSLNSTIAAVSTTCISRRKVARRTSQAKPATVRHAASAATAAMSHHLDRHFGNQPYFLLSVGQRRLVHVLVTGFS